MKVVLDTNIPVSGLLCPFGASGEIVRMLASGVLRLSYDARIISEYKNVLSRPKFSFDQIYIGYLSDQIQTVGEVVSGIPLAKRLPDADDEPFLEVAIAGKVKYLITGNIKHYPKRIMKDVSVVSPVKFLEIYRREGSTSSY